MRFRGSAFQVIRRGRQAILLLCQVVRRRCVTICLRRARISVCRRDFRLLAKGLIVIGAILFLCHRNLVSSVYPISNAVIRMGFGFLTRRLLFPIPRSEINMRHRTEILKVVRRQVTCNLRVHTVDARLVVNARLPMRKVNVRVMNGRPRDVAIRGRAITLQVISDCNAFNNGNTSNRFIMRAVITDRRIPISHVVRLCVIGDLTMSRSTIMRGTIANRFLTFIDRCKAIRRFYLLDDHVMRTAFKVGVVLIARGIKKT